MKHLARIIGIFLLALVTLQTASAQTEKKADKNSKHKSKVTITNKEGKKVSIEKWAEDFGEGLGKSIEKFVSQLEDGSETDLDFDFDFDFEGDFGDIIENALKSMEIELEDLDPEDFNEGDFDDRDGQEILDEIAKKHGSGVAKIQKMKIKILGEDGVKLDMKLLLKNGKVVQESRIIND